MGGCTYACFLFLFVFSSFSFYLLDCVLINWYLIFCIVLFCLLFFLNFFKCTLWFQKASIIVNLHGKFLYGRFNKVHGVISAVSSLLLVLSMEQDMSRSVILT